MCQMSRIEQRIMQIVVKECLLLVDVIVISDRLATRLTKPDAIRSTLADGAIELVRRCQRELGSKSWLDEKPQRRLGARNTETPMPVAENDRGRWFDGTILFTCQPLFTCPWRRSTRPTHNRTAPAALLD